MAKKQISDETLAVDVVINGDEGRQELLKLEKTQRQLKESAEDLRKEKARMIKQNKQGTQEWKNLDAALKQTNKEIKENREAQSKARKAMDLTKLTMSELGKESRSLSALLRHAVPDSDEYNVYKRQLQDVADRQRQLRSDIRGTTNAMGAQKKGLLSNAAGWLGMATGIGAAFEAGKRILRFAIDFVKDARQMAEEAKGVEFAFDRLGNVGESAFNRVKKATRGLLSDLDIKRSIVEFDNFGLSLQEIDSLLEFASVRAGQTGKSFEYMLSSLVEGLSKESKLRIDNLGISAADLNKELEKTPDFVQAVANIAKREINEAGNILDDAANKQEKWNVKLQNFQLFVGKSFSGVSSVFYEIGSSLISAITPTETLTKKFRDQQTQLFSLESQIFNVNTTTEDRLRLIGELKTAYPKLLENIDAETVSNEDLKTALKEVNDQLINKILIAQEQDKIDERNLATADAWRKQKEKEVNLRNKVANIAKKYSDFQFDAQKTELENAKALNDYLQKKEGAAQANLRTGAVIYQSNAQRFLAKAILEAQTAENSYQASLLKGNELVEERDKLVNELGLSLNDPVSTDTKTDTPKKVLTEDEQKERDRLKALYAKEEEEIDKLLQDSRDKRLVEQKEGYQKELAEIDYKYDRIREKYINHEDRLEEIEQLRTLEKQDAKLRLEEEYLAKSKALQDENSQLINEAEFEAELSRIESEKERNDLKLERAREQALAELEIQKELELSKVEAVENSEQLKNQIRENYRLQGEKIEREFAKQETRLKKDQVKWTELTEEQKLSAVTGALGAAADAFNKGSAAWKAIKISETLIATYQSAQNAFNALASIPVVGPALGTAAAGLATVAGLRRVQQIKSTKLERLSKPTQGYEDGLYPLTRTDGKTFNVRYGGRTRTGIVNRPTHFSDDYMAGERGPELVVDHNTMKRLDPVLVRHIVNVGRGVRGYESGLYPVPAAAANASPAVTEQQQMQQLQMEKNNALLAMLMERLNQPITAVAAIGYEDQEKLDELATDRARSSQNANLG